MLSRWETGDRTPKTEQVAQILTMLGIRGAKFESIITLTQDSDAARWLGLTLPEQRQQLAALLDYEREATTVTDVSPMLIPGLLQIPGYIRAIMEVGVPADEVPIRVAVRMGRKEVIDRPEPVGFVAYIGEAALCQAIAPPSVMTAQLRWLLEVGQRPTVEVRLLPFGCQWNLSMEGAYYIIDSQRNGTVVHLEIGGTVLFLHQKRDVCNYLDATSKVADLALDPSESAELIARHAKRWENAR